MKEQELKFKVENYIGFDDDGYLEAMMFVGNGDKPIINEKFNMKDIILLGNHLSNENSYETIRIKEEFQNKTLTKECVMTIYNML